MGKLKGRTGRPRLRSGKPRLGKAPPVTTEPERFRRRDRDQPWSGWKKTAKWQRLRLEILKRDGFLCQQTGVRLSGKYPAPNSPVADHIKPHRGDPELFWDPGNLQAVSKEYHDSTKQSLEKRGLA